MGNRMVPFFSKVKKNLFYLFRQTIHMFKKQQWSVLVVNNVPAKKIQGIVWVSFNHRAWDLPRRIQTPWPPNQKMVIEDFYN